MASPRTILVTVSDDRSGRKEGGYKATQLHIATLHRDIFANWGMEVRQWDFPMMQRTAFYSANRKLMDNIDPARNGRAYKPFVIHEALGHIDFGDYIVYNDCSPEMWPSIFPGKYDLGVLHRLVEKNNDILSCFVKWDTGPLKHGLGSHTHANFTTEICINRMGLQAHKFDFQHGSGFIALRKTPETVEFMREWMYWNLIPECACMGWPGIRDDYSFWIDEEDRKMGHRHDQSISGLLLNKRKAMLIDQPKSEGVNPFNFTQYCRLGVEYQFISSINPNHPGPNEIMKGSEVQNSAGVELKVFEFMPGDGIEWLVVGKNRGSAYKTTRDKLILVRQ